MNYKLARVIFSNFKCYIFYKLKRKALNLLKIKVISRNTGAILKYSETTYVRLFDLLTIK